MSLGIAKTASEIEKIKSESTDYLIWLNACGVIDWDCNTHNYVSDFYENLLIKAYKQGWKDAQPETCEDTVSRKDAIRWVKTECNPYGKPTLDFDSGKKVIEHLKHMSPVTPKRKTGKRIHEIVNDYTEKTYCSECGESAPFELVSDDYYGVHAHGEDSKTDFCPNCGADMRGNKDG